MQKRIILFFSLPIFLSPSPLFPFPPIHTHSLSLFLSLCISWKKLTLISYLNDTPGHDCHVKYDIITESTRNSTKYSGWTNMCRRAKLDTLTCVYNNVYVTYIADSKLRVVKTPPPYRIQRANLQCATRLLSKIVSNVILIHSSSLFLSLSLRELKSKQNRVKLWWTYIVLKIYQNLKSRTISWKVITRKFEYRESFLK